MAFWGDKVVEDFIKHYEARTDKGSEIVVRDEKTASGRVHVGSLRSAALHAIVSEILTERGIKNKFYFEINDFDPMDGLPVYLDEAVYRPLMGKPLYTLPAPEGSPAKNFAEHFGEEYVSVMRDVGFKPTVYRATELYLSGRMDETIRMALDNAADIRRIYKEVSNSHKPDTWYPLSVVCGECGKIGTTIINGWDGKEVAYSCEPAMVEWAKGCGHRGSLSPFGGNAKFPWKVEWAAKFKVLGVHFEGAGKDHYTKGGARHVAEAIAREVFNYEPPFGVPNEFFLVGGKKMSSSKGAGTSAREIVDILPRKIMRLVLLGKDINRQINFDPAGDTIPVLFDQYDTLAEKFWSKAGDDDARLFELVHEGEAPTKHFLPRFSQAAFLVQMPHMNVEEEVTKMKGEMLSNLDKKEVAERVEYARRWLEHYASDEYKFELQTGMVPEAARQFSSEQKRALEKVYHYIAGAETLDGQELHSKLHDIRKEEGLDPGEFFGALYLVFLGKESGPKAGWFLSVLDKKFLMRRLKEII